MKAPSLLVTAMLGAAFLPGHAALSHAASGGTMPGAEALSAVHDDPRIFLSEKAVYADAAGTIAVSSKVPADTANTITTDTVVTSDAPISSAAIADPRVAAQNFVAHINYARVALAMQNGDLARQHITQARNMSTIITGATTEQRRIAHVAAGRVVYELDAVRQHNYFPIEVGRAEVKEMSDGPLWANNSLAVRDAGIVSLTLDLTHEKAESYLAQAETDIAAGKLKDAEIKLGELTDAVVTLENGVSAPIDKARDNIALAQNFIAAKNYDGARFALAHADDALDAMQKDAQYKPHHTHIAAMHKEVKDMRDVITKKDPTMLQKTGVTLSRWITELKSWAKN
mgnify:CR=1 FL=1